MRRWRDTEYFVTEDGDVYRNGRKLKPNLKKGYYNLTPSVYGKILYKTIHRMVAEVYIPNPFNKPQINHIDGNKINNHISNLEWVNASENQLHRFYKLGKGIGESNYISKLTEENVKFIRENYIPRHKEFSQGALARRFGVNQKTIWCVIHSLSWTEKLGVT